MARTFPGYPTSWGNKRVSVVAHPGPSSYVRAGATPATDYFTTGDHVEAAEAGLEAFEFAVAGFTDDADYLVRAVPLRPADRAPLRAIQLVWLNYPSGGEVSDGADLSASVVPIFVIGPS